MERQAYMLHSDGVSVVDTARKTVSTRANDPGSLASMPVDGRLIGIATLGPLVLIDTGTESIGAIQLSVSPGLAVAF